jgi:hypothetical protein
MHGSGNSLRFRVQALSSKQRSLAVLEAIMDAKGEVAASPDPLERRGSENRNAIEELRRDLTH